MRNVILCVMVLLGVAGAQVSSSPAPEHGTPSTAAPQAQSQPQPVPAAAVNTTVGKLDGAIQTTRVDLAKLRVDKWKADGASKRQAQENVDSLQRNIAEALPGMEAQVRSNPGNLAAVFKLYRNLSALYDVLASVTESAGAFGTRDEYQALANDAGTLDSLRRSLADQIELMATARDADVAYLQAQLEQARRQVAVPPKKVIVDENEPEKKPAPKKKKKTAPPPPPAPQ